MTNLVLFKEFSAVICAEDDLSDSLAREYFAILSPDPNLIPLLTAFQQIVQNQPTDLVAEIQAQLVDHSAFKPLIKELIKLWYLGTSDRINELKGGQHYFHYEALIWNVLQAHPTGLTGGYYGYWSYKPEN